MQPKRQFDTFSLTIHSRGTKIVPILLPLTQALGPHMTALICPYCSNAVSAHWTDFFPNGSSPRIFCLHCKQLSVVDLRSRVKGVGFGFVAGAIPVLGIYASGWLRGAAPVVVFASVFAGAFIFWIVSSVVCYKNAKLKQQLTLGSADPQP